MVLDDLPSGNHFNVCDQHGSSCSDEV